MSEVVLALILRERRWFLQRRDPANPVLPGCWEFPGGKAEAGETPESALARELHEEVGVGLRAGVPWPEIPGAIPLRPFLVEVHGVPRTHLAWGWFTAEEMTRLPIPPRNLALLGLLAVAADGPPGQAPPI